jgi:hypothetical protein
MHSTSNKLFVELTSIGFDISAFPDVSVDQLRALGLLADCGGLDMRPNLTQDERNDDVLSHPM